MRPAVALVLLAVVHLGAGCRTPAPAPPAPQPWKPETRALTRDEVLGKVQRVSQPEAKRLLEQAQAAMAAGDVATAARRFATCLGRCPDAAEVIGFVQAGIIHGLMDQRDYESALRLCVQTLATRPVDGPTWASLARSRAICLYKLRRYQEAYAAGRSAAIALAPDLPQSLQLLRMVRSIDAEWPDPDMVTHLRAVQAAELRAVTDAIRRGDAEEVEARLKHRRLSYRVRSIMLTGAEQALAPGEEALPPPPELAALAREALAACAPSPDQPRAYYWRGRLYEFLAEHDKAAADYRAWLENAKAGDLLGQVRHRLACVLRLQGQQDRARELYEANFADPATREQCGVDGLLILGQDAWDSAKAAAKRGDARAAAADWSAAAATFARVMDEVPTHSRAAKAGTLAGQSLLKRGDFAGAAKRLRAVADNYAADQKTAPEALYWLGDAQRRQGAAPAAVTTWRELIEKHPETTWAKYARGRLAEREEPAPTPAK